MGDCRKMREEIWGESQKRIVFVSEMLEKQNLKSYFWAVYVLRRKNPNQNPTSCIQ